MAQITHGQMAKLFRRLSTSYEAGIDIKTAYTRETEIGSSANREVSRAIVKEIRNGTSLGDAMKSTGEYFPELAIAIVSAGEKGGRLEEAFDRLSTHYENLVKFRNGFLLSIAWPLFELLFAIVVIGVVILLLGILVGDEAANWFGMGTATANFLFYVACVLTIAGLIAGGLFGLKNGWFGTLPMQIARRLPLIGKTIEALALSRFAWTMSITENAGMDAIEIARTSLNSTQNYFYKRLIEPVTQSVQAGNQFTTAFRQTDAFPEEFLIYVENGETAGELAEAMDRASHDLQTRAQNNLKIIGTIGFICSILFVGAVIGTIVITLFKQYTDTLQDMANW